MSHSAAELVYFTGTAGERRTREVPHRRRRYTPAQLHELGDSYEPSTVSQDPEPVLYHGWAPESSEDEDEFEPELSNTPRPSIGLQAENPLHRLPRTGSTSSRDSRLSQLSPTSSPDASHFRETEVHGSLLASESSLRTAALLHSVRRSHFSPRSRSHLQNYILDRERAGNNNEDRERPGSSRSGRPNSNPANSAPRHQWQTQVFRQARAQQLSTHDTQYLQQQSQQRQHAQQRQMLSMQRDWVQARDQGRHTSTPIRPVDDYNRQRYSETRVSNSGSTRSLDDAIKYLERLRFCNSLQDSVSSARAGGFMQEDFLANGDFILDTTVIGPPPESSWLMIGGVFSGLQHAAGGPSVAPYQAYAQASNPLHSNSTRSTHSSPLSVGLGLIVGSRRAEQASRRPRGTQSTTDNDERWPVKVTIHSIDYDQMTLAGTMEAFNVPDKTSPTNQSSITTFLEGEIIDFNKYTLETKSFDANARVDGTYWRKLEPFKKLTDDEIVRSLVSRKWLTEELSQKWILMRWKGRCTPRATSGVKREMLIAVRREMLHHPVGSTILVDNQRLLLCVVKKRRRAC